MKASRVLGSNNANQNKNIRILQLSPDDRVDHRMMMTLIQTPKTNRASLAA
jgi:hypothetical protein